MDSGRVSLWLANHAMADGTGHHLGFNRALARAAREAGWDVRVFAGSTFDESIDGRVGRLFRRDWRARPGRILSRHPGLLRIVGELSRRRFRKDLGRLPVPCEGDVIFAQMIAPRHLSEWIGWFRAVNRGGRLVLHLGYDPYRFGRVPACDRVMFVSDSVPLAATYGRILGVRVHVLDHVVDEAIQPCLGQREGGPTRFVSLGSPRREKGFGEILRAIDILRESTEVMFRAQTHGPDADSARCLDGFDRPSTTTFLSHHLSDQEYRDALAVADVVLLPYHLNCYRERTSGVFCEAMVAGKPVITTRGSWMGGEVERSGAGWLVGECDSSGLAAAISLACRERERAAAVARDCAVSSRKRFDAGTFLTGLSRLLDDGD